jgi:cytochrome b
MKIKVWDLAVRIFHWGLFGLLVASMVAIYQEDLDQHMLIGQIILGFLVFRVFWGFWGPLTARFSSFLGKRGTMQAHWQMMRGKIPYKPTLGHNPLGGLMVLVMMAALFVQIGFGLFSFDQIFTYGPLAHLIDDDQAMDMAGYHKKWAYVILGLIILHVLAIGFYRRLKGDDLITPMITGNKKVEASGGLKENPESSHVMLGVRFLLTAGLAYGLVWYLLNKV